MCGSGYALPLRPSSNLGLRPGWGAARKFSDLLTAGQSHRPTSGGKAVEKNLAPKTKSCRFIAPSTYREGARFTGLKARAKLNIRLLNS